LAGNGMYRDEACAEGRSRAMIWRMGCSLAGADWVCRRQGSGCCGLGNGGWVEARDGEEADVGT
jgi:hypothetical protein